MDNGSKKEAMFEKMLEQKKEVKIVRRIVFVLALLILIGGLLGGRAVYKYISEALQPVDPDSEEVIEVEVPIGSGLTSIAELLEKKGLVRNAKVFKYYAKFNNESQFQAGSYGLTKAMTLDELIRSLKTGKVYRTPIFTMTVPEGLTLDQIAKVVEKRAGIPAKEFLDYVNNEQIIADLMGRYPKILTEEILAENVRYPLEGYLYPATYPFYEQKPSVETVVTTMLEATSSNITPYFAYLESNGKSVHWLLTFASLLEKEATAKTDRETIASVFYNRLDEGMPLQTDPTVLYALGVHKDRVLFSDLEVDDPYNTYKHTGLPPGPIANSGKSSIEAVVDPSITDYFYFLADKEGKNHFAKTYEEHLKNRAEHLSGD
ncbi:endolytic transglycosylase MltG [Sporosarcina highlanderae]|uniref:Endolytic murein transglycosylase n=1 Tax=Sporosarcina highlanderae TaxID=3035916 RepID=A0ABT8JQN5_9BACL|nr:endolytic transglycosylase MltG [Sporosarcina highlanderae]MDN4607093.1 endolytic transglycosylase MltG [Sporosarcina highlanderae]